MTQWLQHAEIVKSRCLFLSCFMHEIVLSCFFLLPFENNNKKEFIFLLLFDDKKSISFLTIIYRLISLSASFSLIRSAHNKQIIFCHQLNETHSSFAFNQKKRQEEEERIMQVSNWIHSIVLHVKFDAKKNKISVRTMKRGKETRNHGRWSESNAIEARKKELNCLLKINHNIV